MLSQQLVKLLGIQVQLYLQTVNIDCCKPEEQKEKRKKTYTNIPD